MSESKVELLDFWASWCGPCKVMAPVIDDIEEKYKDKITVKKLEVDDPNNQALVDKYQVMSIPSYLIEKNGMVVSQLVGAQSKKTITDELDKALE